MRTLSLHASIFGKTERVRLFSRRVTPFETELRLPLDDAPSRAFLFFSALFWVPLFVAESAWHQSLGDSSLSDQIENQVAQGQGNLLRQLCYVFVAGLGVACLLRLKDYRVSLRNPMLAAFGSLIAWCGMSTLWADDSLLSLKRLLAYLFMVLAAAGTVALWSHKERLQYMSVGAALTVALGIVREVSFGEFKPWQFDYRFAGTLPDNQNVQGLCCLALAFSSLAASEVDRRHKGFFRLLALFGFTFMVLTRSRSSLLGFAVAFLVYILLSKSMLTKIWLCLGLFTSGLILYMTDVLTPVIDFLSRNGEGVGDFTGRAPVWRLIDQLIAERPIAGYGYASFWTGPRIEYFADEFHWKASSAHNSYREVLLHVGFVGLTLYLLVLVTGIVYGGMLFKRTRAPIYALAAAMFAAVLVVGTLETALLDSPGPYNFGLTVLLGSMCLPQVNSSSSEDLLAALKRRLGLTGRNTRRSVVGA